MQYNTWNTVSAARPSVYRSGDYPLSDEEILESLSAGGPEVLDVIERIDILPHRRNSDYDTFGCIREDRTTGKLIISLVAHRPEPDGIYRIGRKQPYEELTREQFSQRVTEDILSREFISSIYRHIQARCSESISRDISSLVGYEIDSSVLSKS